MYCYRCNSDITADMPVCLACGAELLPAHLPDQDKILNELTGESSLEQQETSVQADAEAALAGYYPTPHSYSNIPSLESLDQMFLSGQLTEDQYVEAQVKAQEQAYQMQQAQAYAEQQAYQQHLYAAAAAAQAYQNDHFENSPYDFDGNSLGGPSSPEALVASEKKRKNKKTFIIIGAIILAILLLIGGIASCSNMSKSSEYNQAIEFMDEGRYREAKEIFDELGNYKNSVSLSEECSKSIEYEKAKSLMADGNYEKALAAFTALFGFKDSDSLMKACQNHLDYEEAQQLLEDGDFYAARELFNVLASKNFLDSAEKYSTCQYSVADDLFAKRKLYDAYIAFNEILGYSDAAERANSCIIPIAESGQTYHNPAFASSDCDLIIKSNAASEIFFIKIYAGDSLVSSCLILPGATLKIYLPAGTYTIKSSYGPHWFGDNDLFGEEGVYYSMTFDEAGSTSTVFDKGFSYNLELMVSAGANVGSKNENRKEFW